MERVAFLVEQTGRRISCLLNPESVVVRRLAGVRVRRSLGGSLTGVDSSDDRLLYTGGGTTELQLSLLFDISIAGSSVVTEDVRELTGPLWNLAENVPASDRQRRLPLVRLVWGKYWNIPGVITAVSERLEYFTEGGAPRRSWLCLRFLRVSESQTQAPINLTPQRLSSPAVNTLSGGPLIQEGTGPVQEQITTGPNGRLDAIAYNHYGDASYWRWIAVINKIVDPLRVEAGRLLQILTR